MRHSSIAVLAFLTIGCRIEKVRGADTTSPGAEPGPGIMACGISPESRVAEDGLGMLRIGATIDLIRGGCTVISEQQNADGKAAIAKVDLGRDTAAVDLVNGIVRRITLHHQAYRTSDSLGVGTHVPTLMQLRDAGGVVEGHKLYAVSPAYCGLRFLVADPAPLPPAAQSGRAALRRLAGETRTLELEIVGCAKRK